VIETGCRQVGSRDRWNEWRSRDAAFPWRRLIAIVGAAAAADDDVDDPVDAAVVAHVFVDVASWNQPHYDQCIWQLLPAYL